MRSIVIVLYCFAVGVFGGAWTQAGYPEHYDPERCGLPIVPGKGVTQKAGRAKRFALDDDPSRQQKIMGGNSVPEGEHPWAVQLFFNGDYACSGTLITDKHVATAAHCFANSPPKQDKNDNMCIGTDIMRSMSDALQNLEIHYGSVCRASTGCGDEEGGPVAYNTTIKAKVINVKYEQYFEQNCNEDDYALLELDQLIDLNRANHACIPHYHLAPDVSAVKLKPYVFGWGSDPLKLDSDTAHKRLQSLFTDEPLKVDDCKAAYHHIPLDAICTVESNVKNSCEGDSGGGLVSKVDNDQWVLLGIVSFGTSCDALLMNQKARVQIFTGLHFHIATIDDFLNAREESYIFH